MAARFVARAPWVTALAAGLLLATAAWTAAAARTAPAAAQGATPQAEKPMALLVPDVRRQAYVFAKGALEQSGFAWRVEGQVQGYAANLVVGQSPAAGARVVADGKPLVLLVLARNPAYQQEGTPENASPYAGRPARLVAATAERRAAAAPAAVTAPAVKPEAKPAAKPAATVPAVKPAAKPAARPAAFAAPGAPREPLTEIPLPQRAKELGAWLERHRAPTAATVNHWLYQHSWIVTGAQFGWWRGAEALKTLIEVDRRAQQLWGVGGKSEQVARRALAEVRAKAQ